MIHQTFLALGAAILLGSGGAAVAQGDRASSSATATGSAPSASATSSQRRRIKPAGRDAANATSRDLSDGAAPAGQARSVAVPKPARTLPRERANATSRDLSDSSAPASSTPGFDRTKRGRGARSSEGANATSRDLTGSGPTPPATGK